MLKKEKPMLSVAAIIQSQGRWDRLAYSGNILHRGLIIMFRSLYNFTWGIANQSVCQKINQSEIANQSVARWTIMNQIC